MGTLGYYRGFNNGIGELGCVLKPEFHGKGLMIKAMKLVAEFGPSYIGLTKVIAITDKNNNSAIKLLNRVGFVKTADLKENEIEYQFYKLSNKIFRKEKYFLNANFKPISLPRITTILIFALILFFSEFLRCTYQDYSPQLRCHLPRFLFAVGFLSMISL